MTVSAPTVDRRQGSSVDAHLWRVLKLAQLTPPAQMSLRDAAGLVLVDDITAPFDLPPFDNSAMDGYAVRAEDVHVGGPTLEVIGDIPAGCCTGPLITVGTAARIMTGAPVPPGATAVVPVEYAEAIGNSVSICSPLPLREHIRRKGEESSTGDVVVRRGEVLTPARIAALASFGLDKITVRRRPRVAVLTTGGELVQAGQPRPVGSVYDVSATMLEALLTQDGATITVLDHVPDNEDKLLASVLSAATEHDLLITTGGIGAGAYDSVKQALAPLASMTFGRVAMSPGSPQGLGVVNGTPLLALPGNPAATFVSYLAFGRPLVHHLLGECRADVHWRQARLGVPCAARSETTRFVPANDDGNRVVPMEAAAAHRLSRWAVADCLLRLDAGHINFAVGTTVPAIDL